MIDGMVYRGEVGILRWRDKMPAVALTLFIEFIFVDM